MILSKEQRAVLDSDKRVISCNSLAGSGKSFLLHRYVTENPHLKILYVAFNASCKASAKEWEGCKNLTVHTTHSLALSELKKDGIRFGSRFGDLTRADIEKVSLVRSVEAGNLLKAYSNFVSSSDSEISAKHVVVPKEAPKEAVQVLIDEVVRRTKLLWDEVTRDDGTLNISHDTYMKLWALSSRRLPYQVILLDECMDSTQCLTEKLFRNSPETKIIAMGDINQTINDFRNHSRENYNFFNDHPPTHHLNKTYRFSPVFASVSSVILRKMDWEHQMIGNDQVCSRVGPVDEDQQYHVISMTNAGLIKEMISLQKDKLIFTTKQDLIKTMVNILRMNLGLNTDKDKLGVAIFRDYSDYKSLRDSSRSRDNELGSYCIYIDTLNKKAKYNVLDKLVSIHRNQRVRKNEEADVILSTAHMMKGDTVNQARIASDFEKVVSVFNRTKKPTIKQMRSLRLLYVAVSRPRNVLELPPKLLKYLT